MARDGLQTALRDALQAASQAAASATVTEHEAVIKGLSGARAIRFDIRALPGTGTDERLLLISFRELPADPAATAVSHTPGPADVARVSVLERELAYTRADLQMTIEELQGANQALRSTNEELQSTNEELQSSNEELETSREELQSVNEELVTVNNELQVKIEQLGDMQNDMKNLLDNINVGTLFLDAQLAIRRFTRDAKQVYRLIAGDVGRPLADIVSNLENDDLLSRAQAVLDTLVPYEAPMRTRSGEWFMARIQPYRTLDNVIDGLVLTFHDISKRVATDRAAAASRQLAEAVIDTVVEPMLVLDSDFQVVLASRAYLNTFHAALYETVGRGVYELAGGLWNVPALQAMLDKVRGSDTTFDALALALDLPLPASGSAVRHFLLNGRRVVGNDPASPLILLTINCQPPDA
jgi:two-component system CheB/CheR fusion protein